ncbi:bifunctional phosphopantothenoylcysteine decarboxylase/phosphopantothenate--cysteine ligase CoaBC [Paenibacillus thermoaerophilus]|uniref:Coenzyme A biosynthesis bifunctional protein CoaBC n=1 Tax=Paenibacillus thermoaerophilus TaxID=1215385 RepID=A0ABW2V1P4_9BACL|nr:bifunctional phosphopantothenoylcysteine decarboxylase/phosphopantothenate--cysteine ligase CoaBC [Paenibacillus thermoaerophilus]TMV19149.1 bifunctional phosphopantothenoylcysteine decarboxylase/phosphopantothenate--cysteine ligase CoaBC [Paenibacillus thermoaerophilus]
MLRGKRILLGVTGGIAAYKAAALCSRLTQEGAEVRVILTEGAAKFITPLTFQTLTRHPVYTDTFDERDPGVVSHIDLADNADLVVVAPATANVIAKMAHGIADDMLTTTLLATTAPVLVCPAMNVHMYAHPAVQANMETLRRRGVYFIEPGVGQLACGYVGKGRLAEPEQIAEAVRSFWADEREESRTDGPALPLAGKRVVVTAGGTVERIDPVRYLANDSSGKMGAAIAAAALEAGAEVTLIHGRMSAKAPEGVEKIGVESALDMFEAVRSLWDRTDILVKAAAVADYRPARRADRKIKKHGDTLELELVKNPDIVAWAGEHKTKQYIVQFAAETHDAEENAMDKLRRKKSDLIVLNDVTVPGAGFGTDTNIVRVYDERGKAADWPLLGKDEVARRLIALVAERTAARNGADRTPGPDGGE